MSHSMVTVASIASVGILFLTAAAHAAPDAGSLCKEKKAKAAGKNAAGLAKAFGKNIKKPNAAKLAAGISKAQSKLTKSFAKTEAKGGCQTTGDAAAIEARAAAFVEEIVSAIAGASTTTTSFSSTTTTTAASTTTTTLMCDCCTGANLLTFEATLPSGSCGTLANFRCSDDANAACGDDSDCAGTCDEVVAGGLPASLLCGHWYQGGGSTGYVPSLLPDMTEVAAKVTGCTGGVMTLGAASAAESGSTNTCTSAGCLFGAPAPILHFNPNGSICGILTVASDASGTASCSGDLTSFEVPLELDMFLTGDVLSSVAGPVDVPGVQPCPLCSAQCVGGANANLPCEDNADCPGSTCDGTPNCIGGPNDASACTLGTSGPGALSSAFPTSHDCPPDPLSLAVPDFPILASLMTGEVTAYGVDQPQSSRSFCGFCRDVLVEGSSCFDGDPDPGMLNGCPDSAAQPTCQPFSGFTAGCGTAIPCADDSDCTAPYESCSQRSPGAFAETFATRMTLEGGTAGACLDDGMPHQATVVSAFCIAPTFSPGLDGFGALDLPGPGAMSLEGTLTLSP